jgi:dinuclear metal center YbgI/SA1388 family protein
MSKQPIVLDLYNFIDQIAPFETAESWDNVGLLIGSTYASASKVLLALDITEEVVDEAIDGAFNLIISHHPFIFNGLKAITFEDRQGRFLLKLIEHKISVIAAHTNLDRSFDYGINRSIADYYQLQDIKPLNALHRFGIYGKLPVPMTVDAFYKHTKELFGIEILKVVNHTENDQPTESVQMVALSSGASSDFISDALTVNADVYITSDLKYHESQKVIGTKLILIDVGHFESESIYMKPFKSLLDAFAAEKGYKLDVHVTRTEKPIFKYI